MIFVDPLKIQLALWRNLLKKEKLNILVFLNVPQENSFYCCSPSKYISIFIISLFLAFNVTNINNPFRSVLKLFFKFEYSPWTLDIETNGIMETCRELGITIVAYGVLGRGFLTVFIIFKMV